MNKNELQRIIHEAVASAMEEAVYPENFNVQEFKALPSFTARLKYARDRLPKLGRGSSRAVFQVDDTTVLKVAMNGKGKAQNKVEEDIGYQSGNDNYYPVAKVFETGDDGAWIEMERAIKASLPTFEQVTGIRFGVFQTCLNYWEYKRRNSWAKLDPPREYQDLVLSGENEFMNNVIDLIGSYDMPAGDIGAITSWGKVLRDGQIKMVLIDFGLTRSVWNDYYVKANG